MGPWFFRTGVFIRRGRDTLKSASDKASIIFFKKYSKLFKQDVFYVTSLADSSNSNI